EGQPASVDLEVRAARDLLRVAGRPLFVVVADLFHSRVRLPAGDDAPPWIDREVPDAGEARSGRGVRIAHADPARAAALEELVATALEEERLARRDGCRGGRGTPRRRAPDPGRA